jgi:DnaD/phage-associated family protein
MKDAIYFSHDSNARNDIKIKAMRKEYGSIGYAAFWIIIEMLRESDDYALPLKIYTHIAIEDEVGETEFDSEKFIMDCIVKYELFETDNKNFWSKSLIKRMNKKDEVVKKRKEAAKKRWNNTNDEQKQIEFNASSKQVYANAMQMHSKCNANAMQNDAKESKVKESKVKESKVKESKVKESKENKSKEKQEIFLYYQNNVGQLSSLISEKLADWQKDFTDDIITQAIDRAVFANARNFNYINAILKNWKSQGVKFVADIDSNNKKINKISEGKRAFLEDD